MENCYVLLYNQIDNNDDDLFRDYENIYGKSYEDALAKRFNLSFKRAYQKDYNYGIEDILIQKGYYDTKNNKLHAQGKLLGFCME